jgi:hypothetical protein
MALVVAGGCSGSDIARPTSPATPSASADRKVASPRSGALHITKNCRENTGLAGAFCTISSSNVEQIPIGSKVFYATADGPTFGDSDIIVEPPGPGNNRAFGHCYVDFITLVGLCTLSGGTGTFKWVVASADVSYLGGFDWGWDGTYSFGQQN